MKKYLQIIFLMSDWKVDPRKHLTKEIIKNSSEWSNIILIQLPVSILIHIFTRFKSKIIGYLKGDYKTVSVEGTALLFTPLILFHYNLWLKFEILAIVDVFLLNLQITRFIKKKYGETNVLLWVCYPQLFQAAKRIKHKLLIYDYQDNYDYDFNGNLNSRMFKYNREMIKISDLVICTSQFMYNISKLINEDTILVINGNNFEAFSGPVTYNISTEISEINKPIVGYVGGIKNLLDFELLDLLVKELKNTYFVFIGILYKHARKSFKELLKNNNVIWIQYKEPDILKNYLKRFSVAILPFKLNKFTEGVFPNKMHEYMAAEIPIVSTELPDLEIYSNIIGYSKNHQEFLDYCRKAINGDFNQFTTEYLSIARKNSWNLKAKIINDKIRELL